MTKLTLKHYSRLWLLLSSTFIFVKEVKGER